MKHLVDAVKMSVKQENWYAALSLALTLPDICSKMETPEARTSQRYPEWADVYFAPIYTHEIGASREKHVFLSGKDLYALRCAVLHEGSDSTIGQNARESLDKFTFIPSPESGGYIHCNQNDSHLQLQVNIFCIDVCTAVESWLSRVPKGSETDTRLSNLMKIEFPDDNFIIRTHDPVNDHRGHP